MDSHSTALRIEVHGLDGRVAAFVQEQPEAARRLVEQIHPARVFSQPMLAVAGGGTLTLFPTRAVVRIDLEMEGFPDWPFPQIVTEALELSEGEFRERSAHPAVVPTSEGLAVVFVEIALTNGQRVFLELHVRAEERMPVDFEMLIQQYLSAPSQYVRRRGGGAIVLNPRHFLRLQVHPAPPVAPAGAWSADPVVRNQ